MEVCLPGTDTEDLDDVTADVATEASDAAPVEVEVPPNAGGERDEEGGDEEGKAGSGRGFFRGLPRFFGTTGASGSRLITSFFVLGISSLTLQW